MIWLIITTYPRRHRDKTTSHEEEGARQREVRQKTVLLKLLACRGEVDAGAWEKCSLRLRCCFRFYREKHGHFVQNEANAYHRLLSTDRVYFITWRCWTQLGQCKVSKAKGLVNSALCKIGDQTTGQMAERHKSISGSCVWEAENDFRDHFLRALPLFSLQALIWSHLTSTPV